MTLYRSFYSCSLSLKMMKIIAIIALLIVAAFAQDVEVAVNATADAFVGVPDNLSALVDDYATAEALLLLFLFLLLFTIFITIAINIK